jgi:hypothetical protein
MARLTLAPLLACAALGAGCTAANPAYRGPAEATQDPDQDEGPMSGPTDAAAADAARPTPDLATDRMVNASADAPAPTTRDSAAAPPDAPPPDTRPIDARPPDARPLVVAPAGSLLGYWPLDDGINSRTAQDLSDNRNHGTLENLDPIGAWLPGQYGMALSFPPAAGTSLPRVRIPATTAIDQLREFTIAAWFYRTAVPPAGTHDPVISRQYGTSNAEVFNITCNAHDLIVYIPGTGSQVNFEVRAPNIAVARTWVHAAATYDGRFLRLFANGAQVGERDFPDRLRSSPGAPIYLGANQNSTFQENFEGLIDEVVLYSKALPAASIRALFEGASPIGR